MIFDSFYPTPNVLVQYRKDLDSVIIRWNNEADTEDTKSAYTQILEYAIKHKCNNWMVDARRRVGVDPQAMEWLTSTFYIYAAERMNDNLRVAYLCTPYQLAKITDSPVFTPPVIRNKYGNCSTAAFYDEGAAFSWLVPHISSNL